MKFPNPSVKEYIKITALVVIILAILQYFGILYQNPGRIDWAFLINVGVLLPVVTYILSVLGENTKLFPAFDGMNQED